MTEGAWICGLKIALSQVKIAERDAMFCFLHLEVSVFRVVSGKKGLLIKGQNLF